MSVSLLADIGLAALTAVMIGYAVILDRRLRMLRAGQGDLAKLVRDLTETMAKADRTLAAFREVGEERGQRLGRLLDEARTVADELQFLSERGNRLVEREVGMRGAKGPARSAVEGALAQALGGSR